MLKLTWFNVKEWETLIESLSLSVSSGLSNIIGIIVYISANAGDPSKSDSKKNSYSYGWSFYFGALSFIMAEMVGVLAVHMFIDRHRELRAARARAGAGDYLQGSAIARIPSYRYRYRRRSRSSSRSTDPSRSREASPVGLKGFGALPSTDISMYALGRGGDTLKAPHGSPPMYNSERDPNFLQVHNCVQKDSKDPNRRTTPVWAPLLVGRRTDQTKRASETLSGIFLTLTITSLHVEVQKKTKVKMHDFLIFHKLTRF